MESEVDPIFGFELDAFEDKFFYWNELPSRLKIDILHYLPYPTLRSFMLVSKECWQLASSIKSEAYAIYLVDIAFVSENRNKRNSRSREEEKSVDLIVYHIPPSMRSLNYHKPYGILFVEDENGGCIVTRKKKGRKDITNGVRYDNETYMSASMRAFFHITRYIKAEELAVEVYTMSPELERLLREQPPTTLLSCKSLVIRTEDKALPPLLLPFITPGCKLAVYCFPFPEPGDIFMNSAFFDSEVVRAAPSFDTEGLTGVTDEQFLLLQGHNLCMKAPYISSRGLNRILLQWLEGRRRITHISLRETKPLDHNEILDGLDPARILSWPEVLKECPTISGAFIPDSGLFQAGMRNDTGALLVISVHSDYCDFMDPFFDE